MVKFYEKTKSNYSKDTDHLVTINRNGVWIKERKTMTYTLSMLTDWKIIF